MENEEQLDDSKIDLVFAWAKNTRIAETAKDSKRHYNKTRLACALHDACLDYMDRSGNEYAIEQLRQQVLRLKKELCVAETLLELKRAPS